MGISHTRYPRQQVQLALKNFHQVFSKCLHISAFYFPQGRITTGQAFVGRLRVLYPKTCGFMIFNY